MVGPLSLLPPQLRPAAASRPPAPTALVRPRWRRLLRAAARGRRRRRHLPRRVLPLPTPSSLPVHAAPSPSPARLRRLHPPRAVTLGDSALATCAAPSPAHARPSDADPGVGRRGAGAGAAAAGPGPGLFPPPPPPCGIRRAAHSHGSWEEPSGRPGGGGSCECGSWRGAGAGRRKAGVAGGKGRRLRPVLQLPSEPGRFAIKKKKILTREVPNIVFQRAHPGESSIPPGGRL